MGRLTRDQAVAHLLDGVRHDMQACATIRDLLERQSDRKSTRLNSSHSSISYAVFCLKKKNEMAETETITSIILIKLIRISLVTVRHPRRFDIVGIDIHITLKHMLMAFIGIRVNRAKN